MYSLNGKRVFITGGTGVIGVPLVSRLLAQGMEVRLLARSAAKAASLVEQGAHLVPGDLTQPASWKEALAGSQVVLHLAGIVDEFVPAAEYQRVNVEGTRRLVEAALEAGVERFLHTSSIVVYGLKGRDIHEGVPYRTTGDAYCDTKLAAEQVVRQAIGASGLPGVILQPSPVYGPGDDAWTSGPLRRIKKGMFMFVNGGRGLHHPIYIDDAVSGFLHALQAGAVGEAYILCGPKPVTMREFFGYYLRMQKVRGAMSIPKPVGLALAGAATAAARVTRTSPLITRQEVLFAALDATYTGAKASQELGFIPQVSLEEGMQCVEKWARGQGLLKE